MMLGRGIFDKETRASHPCQDETPRPRRRCYVKDAGRWRTLNDATQEPLGVPTDWLAICSFILFFIS
jgi:hypothetical protein